MESDPALKSDPVAWLAKGEATLKRWGEREAKFAWVAGWLTVRKRANVQKRFPIRFPFAALTIGGFDKELSAESARQWTLVQNRRAMTAEPSNWRGVKRVADAFPTDRAVIIALLHEIPTLRFEGFDEEMKRAIARLCRLNPKDPMVPWYEGSLHVDRAMRWDNHRTTTTPQPPSRPEWLAAIRSYEKAIAMGMSAKDAAHVRRSIDDIRKRKLLR